MRTLSKGVSELCFAVPARCAWILSIPAGMRTIGASGGPFLPQPPATTMAATATTHHEDLLTTQVTTFTKDD